MQIVIEISDKTYEKVKDHYVNPYDVDEICQAILDGTPLPNNHGRLIDADRVEDITWEVPSYTDALNVLTEVRDRVRVLPTIIEEVNANVADSD